MVEENIGLREDDAARTHNDVVLLLVNGKPSEVDAFAKRVNDGCIESDDYKMIVAPEEATRAGLDELFGTINERFSEMIGKRIPNACCELLRERGEHDRKVGPGFYKLIDTFEGRALWDERGVVAVNYSKGLRECLKQRMIVTKRCRERALRSDIPIGL